MACATQAPVEVVAALLAAHPDGEAARVGGVVEGCDIEGCLVCLIVFVGVAAVDEGDGGYYFVDFC